MTEEKTFLEFFAPGKGSLPPEPSLARNSFTVLVIIATSLWYIIERDIFYIVYFPSDAFVLRSFSF